MARFNIAKWVKEHRKKKASSRKPSKKVKSKRSNSNIMAKRKGGRISRGMGGIKGGIDKAAKGLGYAAFAGLIIDRVAPQFSSVAKLGAAYYGGGFPGVAAQFVVGGGFDLGGLFGGGGAGGDSV